jgi:hypothetical protein
MDNPKLILLWNAFILKKKSKTKKCKLPRTSHSSVSEEKFLVAPCCHQWCLSGAICSKYFPALNFVKNLSLKKQIVPQKQGKSYDHPLKSKRACNMFKWSDKVKISGLLKGCLVFSGGWAVLQEKWIRHPQDSTKPCILSMRRASPRNNRFEDTKGLLYFLKFWETNKARRVRQE